jgi:hypothetical protein
MVRYSWIFKRIGIALGVILLSGTAFVMAQQLYPPGQAQSTPPWLPAVLQTLSPTRPTNCAPLPQEMAANPALTLTPDRLTTPIPNFRATITPQVYANIIDLSPELSPQNKSETTVFLCSGNFVLYLAGPEIDIHKRINLEPGDQIISSIHPGSMMGKRPPEPTKRLPASTP